MEQIQRLFCLFRHIFPEVGIYELMHKAGAVITQYYNETWRSYHTMDRHISQFLETFDEIKKFIKCPDIFELAIFYHDIVYVPGGKFNEEASADRAMFDLMDYKDKGSVKNLIMGEKLGLQFNDLDYFIDVDYSVLGSSPEDYVGYKSTVYEEYLTVPQFWEGRKSFLEQLLKKDFIYRTDYFRLDHELRAHRNITEELAGLLK